ncbi:MAG: glycine betaine ABC transporter substrate-binding protein [Candidatus Xenobia bacterium]
MRRYLAPALAVLVLLLGVSCTRRSTVVVGSKKFSESEVLSEMAARLLTDRAHLQVERQLGLGGTVVAFTALQTGQLALYPEYTGSGLEILKEPPVGDAQQTWQHVHDEFLSRWHLVWMPSLGFSNSYALAMREARAEALGIRTIGDLAAHEQQLTFGSTHEFLHREDGWPGLSRVYGFHLDRIVGMEHGLLYAALEAGKIDVMDVYSTDGKIPQYHLQVLIDDKHFFPPYDACFLVRQDALEAHPGMEDALKVLSGRIDNATMQALNYKVEGQGESAESVATAFLEDQGLIHGHSEVAHSRGHGFWQVMLNRRDETVQEIAQHLELTVSAVALAICIGVPLGILMTVVRALSEPVLLGVGAIQTIPSLALLAFMIPLLGLGSVPAIVALFLYALLPIVQNTYTGIRDIEPSLLEAAEGLGLTSWQILRLVKLPLAVPVIMAGIRTATVVTIGTAALAALIGAGGLGVPILTGLSLNDMTLIMAGAVPVSVLAIAVNGLLALVERYATPRGIRR